MALFQDPPVVNFKFHNYPNFPVFVQTMSEYSVVMTSKDIFQLNNVALWMS